MGDLGRDLKQYTFNLLTLIGKEVEDQFGKWNGNDQNVGFLTKYVAAYDEAVQNQADTLKEYEEEQRRTMERALFLFELLSVPGVAWLGAALELRVGPRLFFEYKDGFKAPGKYFIKKVHDEFKSKIFGDAAKDLAGTLLKLGSEKIGSDEQPEINARRITFSPDLKKFGGSLNEEIKKQSKAVQTSINRMAESVNKSSTFGDAIVKRLRKENPGLDRLPYPAQFDQGTRLINDTLQATRNTWASSWLYYGSDPPRQPNWMRITKELERQIWCIWVIQQDLHAEKYGWNAFTEDYKVEGASGKVFDSVGGIGKSYENSPIETRLFEEFNAPLQDYELDSALEAHTKDWAEKQASKMRDWAEKSDFGYLERELRGERRALKPIDQLF